MSKISFSGYIAVIWPPRLRERIDHGDAQPADTGVVGAVEADGAGADDQQVDRVDSHCSTSRFGQFEHLPGRGSMDLARRGLR